VINCTADHFSTLRRGGLYAITPDGWPEKALFEALEAALSGGARLVQYRTKTATPDIRCRQAEWIQRLCAAHRVPLIVNDDPRLAAEVGAAGVHLGIDDPEPAAARRLLGPQAIIGWSCYNDRDRLARARDAGVDYVALGAFFPSTTKPGARRARPADLAAGRRSGLVVVAIGGITPDNGAALIAAGADWLAVAGGLFGPSGTPPAAIAGRAAAFHQLIAATTHATEQ